MVVGRCQCGEVVEMVPTDLGRWGFVKHSCGRRPLPQKGMDIVSSGVDVGPSGRPPQKWSNAVKTTCSYNHRHASKMEARVCERLTIECKALKDVLLQQVKLPILTLPGEDGRVKSMSIDFVILREGRLYRLIDAKAKGRVSRDWPARKRALELSWHVAVEEVDK